MTGRLKLLSHLRTSSLEHGGKRQTYKYERLPASSHPSLYERLSAYPYPSFSRLLELLPGESDDEISYNLHISEIGASRRYAAISYAWGNPDDRVPTLCNGRTLLITRNLYFCLKALRLRGASRILWADAVCIDQKNLKERNQQVC
jgi:hypothetical protein